MGFKFLKIKDWDKLMDIKIINHEKNTINFSIDNLPHILKNRKEFTDLFKVTGVIALKNNVCEQNFKIQLLGSLLFEFSSDPEETIKNFFDTIAIYSQEDTQKELLEILERGICILESSSYTTSISYGKLGLKSTRNYGKKIVVFPRNEDINEILKHKITLVGGKIFKQEEIRLKNTKSILDKLSSVHERLDMMNEAVFNEKVDKLLKKMKIR